MAFTHRGSRTLRASIGVKEQTWLSLPDAFSPMEKPQSPRINRFVVPVTVLLTFISFWRAAAIILADLGSSAYYVGGITSEAHELGARAAELVDSVDEERAAFIKTYFHAEWPNRSLYHAMINTDLGEETVIQAILSFIQRTSATQIASD